MGRHRRDDRRRPHPPTSWERGETGGAGRGLARLGKLSRFASKLDLQHLDFFCRASESLACCWESECPGGDAVAGNVPLATSDRDSGGGSRVSLTSSRAGLEKSAMMNVLSVLEQLRDVEGGGSPQI